jgi:hypothetical protein
MDDLKECREAFEAWARDTDQFVTLQGAAPHGKPWVYFDDDAEDAWEVWQAAWNRRAVPQASADHDAQDKIDAARYRYLRDTETLETAVWEALEGSASVTDSGVLDHAGYRAEFDRAIDNAIRAASNAASEVKNG